MNLVSLWTVVSLVFLVSVIAAKEACIKTECRDAFDRCLAVNQTNRVCRDVDGICRNDGEHWDYMKCLRLECRSHKISVINYKCLNTLKDCLTITTENQMCRDQHGRCRENGSRWTHECFEMMCLQNKVLIINVKCCVRDLIGCVKPVVCRSPGEIWKIPGKETLQTCKVEKNKMGRYSFHYFVPKM